MAVSFVAAGAVKTAASGNLTAVALPAGFAADDIHVCCLATGDNVVSTFPAGWTKKLETNSGTALRLTVAWRRAVAGDAAFTITHAAGDSPIARVFGYRGVVAAGDPFEDAQAQANTATKTITTPDLTIAQANDMILFVAGVVIVADTSNPPATASYSGTNPAFTERQDSESPNTNDVSLVVADGLRTVASAPGARTATVTTGAAAGIVNNVGALLALKDAAAGAVATRPPRSRLVRPRILVPSGARFAR